MSESDSQSTEQAQLSQDDEGPFLPGHREVSVNLGTLRQYTARGGWNVSCECGAAVFESGDEDSHGRWVEHLIDVLTRPVGGGDDE